MVVGEKTMVVASIIILLALIVIALYACAVVARRASDWEEAYWRNRK